jgi:hypothetical protein
LRATLSDERAEQLERVELVRADARGEREGGVEIDAGHARR